MTLNATAVMVVAAASLAAGAPLKVAVKAPGRTPKVNTHWNYTVRVSKGGRPVSATITEAIVDPIGGVHPVEFGKSTRKITNWAFKGTFSDFIIWPPSSRGIPLTLRITIRAGKAKKVVAYHVTPRA
jgi:hypothetical protein